MRLTLAAVSLAILLGACRIDAPPPSPAETGPGAKAMPGGTSGGRFYCQTDRGQMRELALRKLAVRLTTRPGTVRSHLTMEVAGPADERVEAIMRLAVPRKTRRSPEIHPRALFRTARFPVGTKAISRTPFQTMSGLAFCDRGRPT
jgi:hypothetical protein